MSNSDLKFAEDGLKVYYSIAKKMEELMATGAAIAVSAPGVGTIIGAAIVVVGLIKAMTDDEEDIIAALNQLQKQIDEIKVALTILNGRLDELVEQVAVESNRQTMRDLLDYLDDFRILEAELLDRPDDADTAVRVANEAGIVIDKFLRNDYEIWRWTDVVLKESFNPATGLTTESVALAQLRFKNIPTLPVYLTGLMTWISARERVVTAGQRDRLTGDKERIERHRAATLVRPNFNKYDDGPDAVPYSIAENIKWRIRALVVASTTYPRDHVCEFYFQVGSLMTGNSKPGASFDLLMPPEADTCFINPDYLGPPEMELELETLAGCDTLYELSEILGRLAATGTLREPFVGVFADVEVFPQGILYVVDEAADLQWYRNESASRRGGSTEWRGPNRIGNGWGSYTKVINGGGPAIYGVKPNGELMWYGHDGIFEGVNTWRGPNLVGSGWQDFAHVAAGGEYVLYGVHADGRVFWDRHDGAAIGDASTWAGRKEVASGWPAFVKVFGGGDGVLYGIRPDGVLERRRHKGYLTGAADWEPAAEIGTGWNNFLDVVGSVDGVIYAFTRDGRVLWYRYAKRRPPLPSNGGVFAGIEIGPLVNPDRYVWEGPVEIKRNFPALRSVFALMNTPSGGVR